jgi:hypothetical protein
MKIKKLYHVTVKANDANRTVIFDQLVETHWTFNQVTKWMRRKFNGQWKSIYITKAGSNDFIAMAAIDGIYPETGGRV